MSGQVRITRNTFSINEDINPMRQRIIISPSGSWVAPWDSSITHMCDVIIIGAGGAGGSSGISSAGNDPHGGCGGEEGGTSVFDTYSAAGGGGGAGGAHAGGGAGGGAGMVTRVRMPIQGGSAHAIVIGTGGQHGGTGDAANYAEQKGGGVHGGRPMGTEENYNPAAVGTSEGGQGGGIGRDSMNNCSGWCQGSGGGSNGTGFGGGGGGGSYGYGWGVDGGGRGYDGGQNGSAVEPSVSSIHNPGGKGGDGAIIVEWDLPLQ